MKKLEFNEFETRTEAVEMIENVQLKFGGSFLCEEGSDEVWAVSNCNQNETIAIEPDDNRDTFFINTTNLFNRQGEEIIAFIKANKTKGRM
jgi:hypothetical protein